MVVSAESMRGVSYGVLRRDYPEWVDAVAEVEVLIELAAAGGETVVNFEISRDIPWDREKQFKSGLMSYFRHCGFVVDLKLGYMGDDPESMVVSW